MTKIYKINGKEIVGLSSKELSHYAAKYRKLWNIQRQLLEALEIISDKEKPKQGKKCIGCEFNKETTEWRDIIKHTCKLK